MKQKKYIAGLYFRLSQEDERQGESASIDNQRTMLRKYAEEHGFEIHDEYIDDGIWEQHFNGRECNDFWMTLKRESLTLSS